MRRRGRSLLLSVLLHAAGAAALALYAARPQPPPPPPPAADVAQTIAFSPPREEEARPRFERPEPRMSPLVIAAAEAPDFVPDPPEIEERPEEPPPPPEKPERPPPPRPRVPWSERLASPAEAVEAEVPSPVPGRNPPPDYPRIARLRGWEGRVVVEAEIGPDGAPLNVRVLASSGHSCFDEAALRACADWRFRPAPARGTARATVAFDFRLRS